MLKNWLSPDEEHLMAPFFPATTGLMSYLVTRMPFWGANPQQGWPDLDFVFTGGEGCGDHSDPGVVSLLVQSASAFCN